MENFQNENISVLQILANTSEFFNLLKVTPHSIETTFKLKKNDFYTVLVEVNTYLKQNVNDISDRFSVDIDGVVYTFIKD